MGLRVKFYNERSQLYSELIAISVISAHFVREIFSGLARLPFHMSDNEYISVQNFKVMNTEKMVKNYFHEKRRDGMKPLYLLIRIWPEY